MFRHGTQTELGCRTGFQHVMHMAEQLPKAIGRAVDDDQTISLKVTILDLKTDFTRINPC